MSTKDEVKEYIKSQECVGSLMLSGKWGSGKTFLINGIKNELADDYLVVIVSLFGITVEKDIDYKIKEQILSSYIHWDKAGLNVFKSLARIAEGVVSKIPGVSVASTLFSVNYLDLFEVEKIVKKPISKSTNKELELVIVFDDFERTKLGTNDLLGIINKYSEGKGIKTIILLEEEKLSQDQHYWEFKEKVVYSTIRIQNDCCSIINNLICNYKTADQKYGEFIKNNSSVVINVFIQSEYENFRTVKSALYSFERVFSAWSNNGFNESVLVEVFYEFLIRFFEYKHGNFGYNTCGYGFFAKTEEDKKSIEEKYTINKTIFFPEVLNQWIVDGQWDESALVKELRRIYNKSDLTPRAKFLESILWSLDIAFINKELPNVLSAAYEGELYATEYILLVCRLNEFSKEKIELQINPNYNMILSGLKLRIEKIKIGEIDEPNNHRCLSNIETYDPILREIYSTAYEIDERKAIWKTTATLKRILFEKDVNGFIQFPRNRYIDFDDEIIQCFWSMFISLKEHEHQLRALQSLIKLLTCPVNAPEEQKQYIKDKYIWLNKQLSGYEVQFSDSISVSFFSFCHDEINEALSKLK